MSRSSLSAALPVVVVFSAVVAATVSAAAGELTTARIEAALKIARGPESGRAAFHRSYVFAVNDPIVEHIEVITEFRRVVLLAEARIAGGDHLFAQGTRAAQDALRPWQRRVSVIARLRFPPQNAYVAAPPVDVSLNSPSGVVPRLDLRSETLLGLASAIAAQPLPVVGAVAEAAFDAATVGQAMDVAIVRMQNRELMRLPIDFSRLE